MLLLLIPAPTLLPRQCGIGIGLHLIRIVPPLATYQVSRERRRGSRTILAPRSQVASIGMIVIVMNMYVERLTVRV
jgi:hypothetical protein